LLEKLGKLKNTSSALHGGKQAAEYKNLDAKNPNVLVFNRSKNGSTITFIANLSNQSTSIQAPIKGTFIDYIANSKLEINDAPLSLKAWDYKILLH